MKNLFNDLLREKKGFKYILGTKIILNKRINDNEIKYPTVYFNSITKTIINQRYHLNELFEKILNLLDIRINESTGWSVDQIQGLYINTSNYEPLSGRSYIQLPEKLRKAKKDLINIKNKDNKCLLRCHIRVINLTDIHPETISKEDKKIAAKLSYSYIDFPLDINDF